MAAVVLMLLQMKPTGYNGDFMMLNKLSNADLNAIIKVAEEVISAIAGENEEVHPDNSTKMCALWDDLNDRHATPEVVRAMAGELLAYREASKNPVADVVAWNKSSEERKCDIRWRRFDVAPGPLYAAPPIRAMALPEGWCFMPLELIRKMTADSQQLSKIQGMTPNLFTNPHQF